LAAGCFLLFATFLRFCFTAEALTGAAATLAAGWADPPQEASAGPVQPGALPAWTVTGSKLGLTPKFA